RQHTTHDSSSAAIRPILSLAKAIRRTAFGSLTQIPDNATQADAALPANRESGQATEPTSDRAGELRMARSSGDRFCPRVLIMLHPRAQEISPCGTARVRRYHARFIHTAAAACWDGGNSVALRTGGGRGPPDLARNREH